LTAVTDVTAETNLEHHTCI